MIWHIWIVSEDEQTNAIIRKDGRCGSSFKLDDGSLSECDPYSAFQYCCSEFGYCGDSSNHCDCTACVDYRKHYSLNITTTGKGIAHETYSFSLDCYKTSMSLVSLRQVIYCVSISFGWSRWKGNI